MNLESFLVFSRITIYDYSRAHECKISPDVCAIVLNFYLDDYWYIYNY